MVHRSSARPRLRPVVCSLLATATLTVMGAPWAAAQTSGSSPTTTATSTLIPLPTSTTTAPPAPASTTTTAPPAAKPQPSSTTTKPAGGGVPPVPVGGPPTTAAPPGAKPAPPPDPNPILAQVDTDLAQLTAISEYQAAQGLVARAQARVTAASATVLSARQALTAAQAAQGRAASAKSVADSKLRQMAIAAYIGVGYTTPGFNQPPQGNGHQGAGTVSTPGGLTGISAIDAKEMLILVGQHARQDDNDAARSLGQAAKSTQAAQAAVQKDRTAVSAAEAQLLSAQQTLKVIQTAATTPGAAAATNLPDLLTAQTGRTPSTKATTADPAQPAAASIQPAGTAATVNGAKPTSPDILGHSALNATQLAAWWATLNRKPNITVPINKLISSYAYWGAKLGVRYDVAFAQSVIETGYFSFPSYGQLTDKDNNFAGIGACDTCAHGWSFPTADTGVQAQLELLREYATDAPLPAGVKNVIGGTGVGGCCQTWTQLAGRWASSTVYGISIMTVYHRMLTWLIPQQEMAVGLIAPTSAPAKGPELAPLAPGATKPATAKPGTSAKAGATTTTTPQQVSAAAAGKRR